MFGTRKHNQALTHDVAGEALSMVSYDLCVPARSRARRILSEDY